MTTLEKLKKAYTIIKNTNTEEQKLIEAKRLIGKSIKELELKVGKREY